MSRPGTMPETLSHLHRRVLLAYHRASRPPKQTEIAKALDYSAPVICQIVKSLRNRGLLTRIKIESRARPFFRYKLTTRGEQAAANLRGSP